MKKTLVFALLVALCAFPCAALSQNSNSSNTNRRAGDAAAANARPPIFRATKEQIKQAQAILKQRGFHAGDANGKLDADTRAALKKYQEAETLKPTGTLNRVTLEKMNIPLTDRQKSVAPAANRNAM